MPLPFQKSRAVSPPPSTGRTVISASPALVVVRDFDPINHDHPERRGGYLVLDPSQAPTIVLDGLASEAEQLDAEMRCRRELMLMQQQTNMLDEGRDGAKTQPQQQRRELVHYSGDVIVSRERDPEHHMDPQRRGAYLVLQTGRIPEVVLDGLSPEAEQQEALDRCLRILEGAQRTQGAVRRLPSMLAKEGQPAIFSGSAPAEAVQRAPAQRLGERLVAAGLLSREDLATTLRRQRQLPQEAEVRRLGSLLVEEHRLTSLQVTKILAMQNGVRATTSMATRIDAPLRGLFPADLLRQVEAAPLFVTGKTLGVAMCDPQDAHKVAALQARTALHVQPLQATQHQVHHLLHSLGTGASSGGDSTSSVPAGPQPAGQSIGSHKTAQAGSQWSPRSPSTPNGISLARMAIGAASRSSSSQSGPGRSDSSGAKSPQRSGGSVSSSGGVPRSVSGSSSVPRSVSGSSSVPPPPKPGSR